MSRAGGWQGQRNVKGISIEEKVHWAWKRYLDAERLAKKFPDDPGYRAAVAGRRTELDLLLRVAPASVAKSITDRATQRARKLRRKQ